jgi:hypothetical protein
MSDTIVSLVEQSGLEWNGSIGFKQSLADFPPQSAEFDANRVWEPIWLTENGSKGQGSGHGARCEIGRGRQ